MVALPSIPMKIAFYLAMALTAASALCFYRRGKGAYLLSLSSAATLIVSLASILSFISVYFYELPTHHCPFCILQREYGYIGYPLYITLFGATISGMGVGILRPFRERKSLSEVLPSIQRRLAITSLVLLILFAAIVTYGMVFSGLILEE
jgi:hypothetical protein